jgi:hypothetical protein
VIVEHILPQLRPELALLVEHAVQQGLTQAPLARELNRLPGVSQLTAELSKQVGHQTTQVLLTLTQGTLSDQVGQQLTQKLVERVVETSRANLKQQGTLETIEPLIADWLEELKLTVMQRLDGQDQQRTLQEAENLRWLSQQRATPIPTEIVSSTLPK